MNQVTIFIEEEYEVFSSPTHTPERVLLAAILERAVRDLGSNVPIYETRQAVSWFEDRRKHAQKFSDSHFSFKSCVEGLELSCFRVAVIHAKLEVAKEFLRNYSIDPNCPDTREQSLVTRTRVNKSMPKREACRESRCALVE